MTNPRWRTANSQRLFPLDVLLYTHKYPATEPELSDVCLHGLKYPSYGPYAGVDHIKDMVFICIEKL